MADVANTLAMIREQLSKASRPIVLCSFGKDSIVLLHLCLRVQKVPVLFFRMPKFPEKHAHAESVIRQWDLEVHDMWPTTIDEYQCGDYFEVYQGYMMGNESYLYLASGVRVKREAESRALCAVHDLLGRPRSFAHLYPWDLTFHGQKSCDRIPLGEEAPIMTATERLGVTTLSFPLAEWTDEDIWSYIVEHDLPYDRAVYDANQEKTSPDRFPTCYRCLDVSLLGQMVYCPREQRDIQNMAKSAEEHAAFRESLRARVQYCQITGEPETKAT